MRSWKMYWSFESDEAYNYDRKTNDAHLWIAVKSTLIFSLSDKEYPPLSPSSEWYLKLLRKLNQSVLVRIEWERHLPGPKYQIISCPKSFATIFSQSGPQEGLSRELREQPTNINKIYVNSSVINLRKKGLTYLYARVGFDNSAQILFQHGVI